MGRDRLDLFHYPRSDTLISSPSKSGPEWDTEPEEKTEFFCEMKQPVAGEILGKLGPYPLFSVLSNYVCSSRVRR